MLNLKNAVQVRRVTLANDGYGAMVETSTLTTIARANIWQPGSSDVPISDKITKFSTHVLALEYGKYTFTDDDRQVLYGGNVYEITGHPDNVATRNRLVIVGLKWLS
jgi:head-tail adaptor